MEVSFRIRDNRAILKFILFPYRVCNEDIFICRHVFQRIFVYRFVGFICDRRDNSTVKSLMVVKNYYVDIGLGCNLVILVSSIACFTSINISFCNIYANLQLIRFIKRECDVWF